MFSPLKFNIDTQTLSIFEAGDTFSKAPFLVSKSKVEGCNLREFAILSQPLLTLDGVGPSSLIIQCDKICYQAPGAPVNKRFPV